MDSTKMENSQWLAGIRHFFGRPFFSDPRTLLGLWLILGVVSALTKIHKCNNFLIFKYVFWHAWEQTSFILRSFSIRTTMVRSSALSLLLLLCCLIRWVCCSGMY